MRGPKFAVAAAFAAGLAASGCSIAVPIPSLLSDDDETASIQKPLSDKLDAEDLRRADAAMSAALDPKGDGAPVAWHNPKSGAKGTFTAVAAAYKRANSLCRAFVAEISPASAKPENVQGSACRGVDGAWIIRDVRPWKGA